MPDILLTSASISDRCESSLAGFPSPQTNALRSSRDPARGVEEATAFSPRRWNRLAIREKGRVTFLRPQEVDWVKAEGNYVRIAVGRRTHLLRETLQWAATRLAAHHFLRVSRSYVVNLERVKEWQPLFHGDSVLILEDGTRITVSRFYRDRLEAVVGQLS